MINIRRLWIGHLNILSTYFGEFTPFKSSDYIFWTCFAFTVLHTVWKTGSFTCWDLVVICTTGIPYSVFQPCFHFVWNCLIYKHYNRQGKYNFIMIYTKLYYIKLYTSWSIIERKSGNIFITLPKTRIHHSPNVGLHLYLLCEEGCQSYPQACDLLLHALSTSCADLWMGCLPGLHTTHKKKLIV